MDIDCITDQAVIVLPVDVGSHCLNVCLTNKTTTDTEVDSSGNITDDMYAVITKFSVDGIDFTDRLDAISDYTDWSGNSVQTNGWLSFATPYKIYFQVPGFYFYRNASILSDTDLKTAINENF